MNYFSKFLRAPSFNMRRHQLKLPTHQQVGHIVNRVPNLWNKVSILLVGPVFLIALNSCGSMGHRLTFLRPPLSPNDEHVTQLKAEYASDAQITTRYKASDNKKAARNKIVNDLLFLINDYYSAYELSWYATATGHGFASDLATLGLDTAATAVGGAGIKTLLTAISTGVGGQKIAVQRDFFQNQNIAIIIKNMRAARADVLVKIRSKEKEDVDTYPLEDALLDLQEYFAAGTIIGGIQHAQDTAALEKIIADEASAQGVRVDKLSALRTAQSTLETSTQLQREKLNLLAKIKKLEGTDEAKAELRSRVKAATSTDELELIRSELPK